MLKLNKSFLRYYIILMAILCCGKMGSSQKNRSVAGDASTIYDILTKSYISELPENRKEAILKDLLTCYSTLISYLEQSDIDVLNKDTNQKILRDSITKSLDSTINNQNEINAYLQVLQNNTGKIDTQIQWYTTKNTILGRKKDSLLNQTIQYYLNNLDTISNQYNINSKNNLLKETATNIKSKFKGIYKSSIDPTSQLTSSDITQKSLPFFDGELVVETIIDGFSKYLAERIKKEIINSTLGQIEKLLKKNEYEDPFLEFQILLPNTHAYLSNYSSLKLHSFSSTLRSHVEDDIGRIFDNVHNLKESPRIKLLIDVHPEAEYALEALNFIPKLKNIKDPVDLFVALANSNLISAWAQDTLSNNKFNIGNAFKLSNLITSSLTIKENGTTQFISSQFVEKYFFDTSYTKIYLGFLEQQNKKYHKIKFNTKNAEKSPIRIDSFLIKKVKIINEIQAISLKVKQVNDLAQHHKTAQKQAKSVGADTTYEFINSILDLSEQLLISTDTIISSILSNNRKNWNGKLSGFTKPYFLITRNTNNALLNFKQKKYAQGLIKMLNNANYVSPKNSIISSVTDISEYYNLVVNTVGIKNEYKGLELLDSLRKGSITVNTKNKNRAENLLETLTKWKINSMLSNNLNWQKQVDTISEQLVRIIETKNGDQVDANGSKAIITDSVYFRNFVIFNYYSKKLSKPNFVKIVNCLDSFRIKGNKYFTNDDLNYLKDFALDSLIYKAEILNDRAANKKLKSKRKELKIFISRHLEGISSKFEFELPNKLVQIIYLLNDLSLTTSSDEAKVVFENFFSPPGSFRAKNEARWSVSISTFPGFTYNIETQKNIISTNSNGDLNFKGYGFTAPVGLNISKGISSCFLGSANLFFPIFDIGALTQTRLVGLDSLKVNGVLVDASQTPEFNFANIVAPGIFTTFTFANFPLSVYAGYQKAPDLNLTNVKTGTGEIEFRRGIFKWSFGLTLDMPLYSLHRSEKL